MDNLTNPEDEPTVNLEDAIIVHLQQIVNRHTFDLVGDAYVDCQTAQAILTVYVNLSAAAKERYLSFPVSRIAEIAWKLIGDKK